VVILGVAQNCKDILDRPVVNDVGFDFQHLTQSLFITCSYIVETGLTSLPAR
jgi:hypothetical protein